MIKKTVYAATFLALTIGAVYSYDQVRFGERTAVFFRTAFAEEGSEQRGRGDRGHEGRGRGGSSTRRGREQGDAPAADVEQMRESARERSGASRGRGGHGGRGASISLEEVGYYTIIFTFATMFTYTLDGLVKRAGRGSRTAV